MRLSSGKRIGQSGSELAIAVVFSCVIHILTAFSVIFLYTTGFPKVHVVPPYYQVKLVDQPTDLSQTPQGEVAPVAPKQEEKPQAAPAPKKTNKAAARPIKTSLKKSALPELSQQKPKQTIEQAKPAETVVEKPQASTNAPGSGAESSGEKAESVAVATPQQDFKFPYYLVSVRNKIGQNWRPPPDAKDAKARVIFTINRSGWVGDVNLAPEHTSGTFGFQQAAIRAIRASNPFPKLPEEFLQQSLQFTVDLMAE